MPLIRTIVPCASCSLEKKMVQEVEVNTGVLSLYSPDFAQRPNYSPYRQVPQRKLSSLPNPRLG